MCEIYEISHKQNLCVSVSCCGNVVGTCTCISMDGYCLLAGLAFSFGFFVVLVQVNDGVEDFLNFSEQ